MLTKKEISKIVDHFGEGRFGNIFTSKKLDGEGAYALRNKLVELWRPFGFAKSLQQIVDDSGWERKVFCACGEELKKDEPHECRTIGKPTFTKQLKNPQARELFEFLNTLINAK